jgi:ankyrin repeat protein
MTITMKHIPFLMTLLTLPLAGAELDLKTLLEQGLVAEEVNGDLEAAATAYQKLVTEGEAQQRLFATGLFRLAEVRRKQGQSEEAVTLLQRLLAEHPAQKELVERAGEILTTLGVTPSKPMTDPTLATLDVEEAKEIARMERLLQESPDRAKKEYPLHLAAEKGWLELARRMIERGFDVNQTFDPTKAVKAVEDRYPATPLVIAVHNGHLAMCQLLIDAKADLNDGGYLFSGFPVSTAIESNNAAVLDCLLAAGASTEKAVSLFAKQPEPAIGRSDMQISVSGTPLHLACQKHSPELIRVLLTHGAKVDAVTVLQESAQSGKSSGAGQTPLFFANGSGKIIDTLLAAGASLEASDDQGRTAVFYAFHFEYPNANGPDSIQDTLSDLIRLGANVNARDKKGMTALLYCAQEWSRGRRTWTNLRKLVSEGADPGAVDASDNGLLHYFIPSDEANRSSPPGLMVSEEAIDWLFSLKLDPQLKNKEGKTALDLALAHPQANALFTAYLMSVAGVPDEGLWWCNRELPLRRIYKPMSVSEPLPDLAQALMLVRSVAGWQQLKQKRLQKPKPVESVTESVRERRIIPAPVQRDPASASTDLLFAISKTNSATKALESVLRVNGENLHQAGDWQLKNGTVLLWPPPSPGTVPSELQLATKTDPVATIDVQHGEVKRAFDLRPDRTSGPLSDSDSGLQYAHYGEVILGAADALKAWAPMPGRKAKLTRQIDGKPVELIMDLESEDPSDWPRPLTGDVVELLPQDA